MIWAAGLLLARTLLMEGLVLEVRPAENILVVSHKEIPGVMPAMTMPVHLKDPRLFSRLYPGVLVRFELVTSNQQSFARNLKIRKPENSIEEGGRKVPLTKPSAQVAMGTEVPDFELVDHTGSSFRLSSARGKVVAVQFLYTRCPMAEVCPRLAATFSRIARKYSTQLGRELILLSVTLDPKYDTPQVLSAYAANYRADGVGWKMLTGSESKIKQVAESFGIIYWAEEGAITHTSNVAVIGRDGRLKALVEGLGFDARQLEDLVGSQLR